MAAFLDLSDIHPQTLVTCSPSLLALPPGTLAIKKKKRKKKYATWLEGEGGRELLLRHTLVQIVLFSQELSRSRSRMSHYHREKRIVSDCSEFLNTY